MVQFEGKRSLFISSLISAKDESCQIHAVICVRYGGFTRKKHACKLQISRVLYLQRQFHFTNDYKIMYYARQFKK